MNKQLNIDLRLTMDKTSTESYILTGIMRYHQQPAVDFLVSSLTLESVALNGEPAEIEVENNVLKVKAADEVEIKYISHNFSIMMPVPLTLKVSFSSLVLLPAEILVHKQTYAENCRALKLPEGLFESGQVRFLPCFAGLLAEFEHLQQQLVVLEGFYDAMRFGNCFVLWMPRSAPNGSASALLKAVLVVVQTFQDSNVSLLISSEVSRHALLLHFFFGFLAKSNYFGYFCVRNALLCQPYNEADKGLYYDKYGAEDHMRTACLALAIMPLKFVREEPQFSEDNAKSAHNNMLRENFQKYQAEYHADIFPTQGMEPGDVFKAAFQDSLTFSAYFREFVIERKGIYAMLQFLGKSSWKLQMNQLYLDSTDNVQNNDIIAFRSDILGCNLQVQAEFDRMQIFCSQFVQQQKLMRVECKMKQFPVDEIGKDVLTCMQCYVIDEKIPSTYADDACESVAAPANAFKKYADEPNPITVRPAYYHQLSTTLEGVVFCLLQFNYLPSGAQAAELDWIAQQLYHVLKHTVLDLFANEQVEADLNHFIAEAVKLQLLFASDRSNSRIFELICDLRVFLRGISLNVMNSFEVRELAVMFLLFLGDHVWIKQILTYLQNQLAESTSNLSQIVNLLTSLWPAIITINDVVCDEILLEMLGRELDKFSDFWLERMCFGHVSNYILEQTIKHSDKTERVARIMLVQLLYYARESQSRIDFIISYLKSLDFSQYRVQLAELLLVYPRECPAHVQEFMYRTQQVISIPDFVSQTLRDAGDIIMYNIAELKARNSAGFAAGVVMYCTKASFLQWNVIYMPQIALAQHSLFDVSDYSCLTCFCGACNCARSKMLRRLGVEYPDEIEERDESSPQHAFTIRYGSYLLYQATK